MTSPPSAVHSGPMTGRLSRSATVVADRTLHPTNAKRAAERTWAALLQPVDPRVVLADRRLEGGRWSLSTRAAGALRGPTTPVALVPPTCEPLRRIGVALHPDRPHGALIDAAAGLAHTHDADLVLLSVLDADDDAGTQGWPDEAHVAAARHRLQRAERRAGTVRARRQLHAGDPVHQLLGLAQEVDLLVLGVPGPAGYESSGPPPIASSVCRRAPIAVLLVPTLPQEAAPG